MINVAHEKSIFAKPCFGLVILQDNCITVVSFIMQENSFRNTF